MRRHQAAHNDAVDRLRETSAFSTDPEGNYADAARDLDMTLPAVKMAIHRLRRRYREAVPERVADTVSSAEEVDGEIRHLMKSARM